MDFYILDFLFEVQFQLQLFFSIKKLKLIKTFS